MPGIESAELEIFTTNGVAGYSTELPISIQGTTISNAPFLVMSPLEVNFGGIALGGLDQSTGPSDWKLVRASRWQWIGSADCEYFHFDDSRRMELYPPFVDGFW